MDNFNELDESVISSPGRKRKIKGEKFSQSLAKAARYNDEGNLRSIQPRVRDLEIENLFCTSALQSLQDS